MSAFVDTSALYALLVRSEERHAETVRAFERLLNDGRRLWTHSYVLVESTALLQHRLGLEPVRDFSRRFVPLLDVLWVDAKLHRRAVARLIAADRRHLSLVDCVSLETLRDTQTRVALALDPHLAEEGATLLPSDSE